jgi:BON domain
VIDPDVPGLRSSGPAPTADDDPPVTGEPVRPDHQRRQPSRRTLAAVLITLVGLGALTVAQVVFVAPGIESRLRVRSEQALRAAGISGVAVHVDGRDVTLTGTAKRVRDVSAAEHVVLGVPGVRYVDSAGVHVPSPLTP